MNLFLRPALTFTLEVHAVHSSFKNRVEHFWVSKGHYITLCTDFSIYLLLWRDISAASLQTACSIWRPTGALELRMVQPIITKQTQCVKRESDPTGALNAPSSSLRPREQPSGWASSSLAGVHSQHLPPLLVAGDGGEWGEG